MRNTFGACIILSRDELKEHSVSLLVEEVNIVSGTFFCIDVFFLTLGLRLKY